MTTVNTGKESSTSVEAECLVERFVIRDGDTVYLSRPLKVIRRTKEGRCLCLLYDREVSIPETMLHNEAGRQYLDECKEKSILERNSIENIEQSFAEATKNHGW